MRVSSRSARYSFRDLWEERSNLCTKRKVTQMPSLLCSGRLPPPSSSLLPSPSTACRNYTCGRPPVLPYHAVVLFCPPIVPFYLLSIASFLLWRSQTLISCNSKPTASTMEAWSELPGAFFLPSPSVWQRNRKLNLKRGASAQGMRALSSNN